MDFKHRCARFLMFCMTLTGLTCYIGCVRDLKTPFPSPGSKIIIVGGSVMVFSPIEFTSETLDQAVITNSRRKATKIHFPGSQSVQIPAGTPWQLEVQPT